MLRYFRSKMAYALRRRLGFPLEELALLRLRNAGLQPKLVFDVGASFGPFVDNIWRVWPDAEIHCFEPEPEYAALLEKRASTNTKLHVCKALVGATARSTQAYYFHLGASSILPSTDDSTKLESIRTRSEKMITLDHYCEQQGIKPDFLKIDVQGFELEVLKGAENALSSIEVVFTEVNHIAVYRSAPLAAELIAWLANRGYALHDICNFMPRPRDGALWQSDMIFVRHESHLRASKDW